MKFLAQQLPLEPIQGPTSPYVPDSSQADASSYLSTAETILSNVLAILSIIGAIMFAINFLLGGLNWISAGGDQGKIDKAKKQMTGAAIGLIIIAASYAITSIVGAVTGIEILNPAATITSFMEGKQ